MWRLRYFVSISYAFGTSQRRVRTLEWFRGISKTLLSKEQERRIWLFRLGDLYKRCWKWRLGEAFVRVVENGFQFPLNSMMFCKMKKSHSNRVKNSRNVENGIHFSFMLSIHCWKFNHTFPIETVQEPKKWNNKMFSFSSKEKKWGMKIM